MWPAGPEDGRDGRLSGQPDRAPAVIGLLLDHVRDALADAGDLATVTGLIEELLRRGNGAAFQRDAFRRTGGRLMVGPDLRVEGQERIFATGDIALAGAHPLPQLAQPAIQMGRHAAEQIRRLEAGQETVPFQYHDKGTMATIGSRSAVVELNHGIRFRGTIAWLAWLALHLVTLLGGRNRINTLINLSYRYLSWRRGGGIIVGDDPPAPNAEGN